MYARLPEQKKNTLRTRQFGFQKIAIPSDAASEVLNSACNFFNNFKPLLSAFLNAFDAVNHMLVLIIILNNNFKNFTKECVHL